MTSSRWNVRGFTGVELLVVVVVIGIIGSAVAGTHVYAKRRAMQRVVEGDLDAYAEAQVAQRAEHGRFATHDVVVAGGFQWSDDIELSQVKTAPDRFYIRVRHRTFGYACALDFSPVTGRAVNRKRCSADAGDPVLAIPPSIAVVTPPTDTVSVGRVPRTPPPGGTSLLAPEVGDLPAIVLAPGTTRVLEFPVRNRSQESRTLAFTTGSADPRVVNVPLPPADARLRGDESAGIPVAVSVAAGALADRVAVVELRASDAAERGLSAAGQVPVGVALSVAAPWASTPSSVTRDPGETFAVSYVVRNRTNAARVLHISAAIPSGSAVSVVDGAGDQTFDAFEEREVVVRYRLDAAAEGGSEWLAPLIVADRDAPAHAHVGEPLRVVARLNLEAPAVTPFPTRTEAPGGRFTVVWRVTNRSNAARDITLTPSASGSLLAPVSPAESFTRRVERGASVPIAVEYRLGAASTCGARHDAMLRATDGGVPSLTTSAEGTVNTALVIAAPDIVAPIDRSELPGATFVGSWRVGNRSNCTRSVRVEAQGAGDLTIVRAAGDGEVRMKPFEERRVDVTYRLDEGSEYRTESAGRVTASDAGSAEHLTQAAMAVGTALKRCAPVISAAIGVPAQPQDPGTSTTVTFRVTNCSNASRTIQFDATSGTPEVVPEPSDPSPTVLRPGASADVAMTYRIPSMAEGQRSAELRLRARDSEDVTLTSSSAFSATVGVVTDSPTLSVFGPLSLLPGTSGTGSTTLVSRSNVAATFCFESAVQAGSAPAGAVVSATAAPACVRVGPYGSAPILQSATVAPAAEHPRTNVVSVTARDAERPALRAHQPLMVTAGLALAKPTMRIPITPPPMSWMVGADRRIEYPVTNWSNGAREICLSVVPGGPSLVPATPGPVCATVAARTTQVFAHILRGFEPGEPVVAVEVWDRISPGYRDAGSFRARVLDARPVALWTRPERAYVRKWVDFDASASYSPLGAPVVSYIWSWGLFNQRWSGTRFESGGTGVATDAVTTPLTQRAWDFRGTFIVCLVVEDATGRRSEPNCGAVSPMAETRARLAFRYRGWWYEPGDLCIDVPWDNQCPREHGNARWEILLNQSQGDVPIRRAWANLRVDLWQTDDEFERTYAYEGNVQVPTYSVPSETGPVPYDFLSNRDKAEGSAESGRWRVLDTEGTAGSGWPRRPNLGAHPLVLNVNLGAATGAFDGGPHWVPDDSWLTLFVEDETGTITRQSVYLNHTRAEWRGSECIGGTSGWLCTRGFERLVAPQEAPTVSLRREDLGANSYRFSGSGSSPDGRTVDRWWEVLRAPIDMTQGPGKTTILRGDTYTVTPYLCERVEVSLVYIDDRGQQARAGEEVRRGDEATCIDGGTRQ